MIVFLDSATLVTVYINRNNFVVHCYLDNQYKIYLQGDPEITVERVRGSRAEIIFKKAVPENATKSQENTCTRVSFSIKTQVSPWKRFSTH